MLFIDCVEIVTLRDIDQYVPHFVQHASLLVHQTPRSAKVFQETLVKDQIKRPGPEGQVPGVALYDIEAHACLPARGYNAL
jgi:hypothetical protein